jgi:hypothetical protein
MNERQKQVLTGSISNLLISLGGKMNELDGLEGEELDSLTAFNNEGERPENAVISQELRNRMNQVNLLKNTIDQWFNITIQAMPNVPLNGVNNFLMNTNGQIEDFTQRINNI